MEEEKEIGIKFIAPITGLKGSCHANHRVGQKFELNCYDYLNAMQFGGKYTWWDRDSIKLACPDH